MNTYGYVGGNPLRFVDPFGLSSNLLSLDPSFYFEQRALELGNDPFTREGASATATHVSEEALLELGIVSSIPFTPTAGVGIFNGILKIAPKFCRVSASARAKQIHSALDSIAQSRRTTAVTETKEGIRVISSSRNRLTPAQRAQLGKNEIEGIGPGHAELTGVNAAKNAGLTPTGTAASRPICPNCASTLESQGIDLLSPLK